METNIVLEEWVRCCLEEHVKPLTDWEEQFLQSIGERLSDYGRLSERQVEILERIYAEKT